MAPPRPRGAARFRGRLAAGVAFAGCTAALLLAPRRGVLAEPEPPLDLVALQAAEQARTPPLPHAGARRFDALLAYWWETNPALFGRLQEAAAGLQRDPGWRGRTLVEAPPGGAEALLQLLKRVAHLDPVRVDVGRALARDGDVRRALGAVDRDLLRASDGTVLARVPSLREARPLVLRDLEVLVQSSGVDLGSLSGRFLVLDGLAGVAPATARALLDLTARIAVRPPAGEGALHCLVLVARQTLDRDEQAVLQELRPPAISSFGDVAFFGRVHLARGGSAWTRPAEFALQRLVLRRPFLVSCLPDPDLARALARDVAALEERSEFELKELLLELLLERSARERGTPRDAAREAAERAAWRAAWGAVAPGGGRPGRRRSMEDLAWELDQREALGIPPPASTGAEAWRKSWRERGEQAGAAAWRTTFGLAERQLAPEARCAREVFLAALEEVAARSSGRVDAWGRFEVGPGERVAVRVAGEEARVPVRELLERSGLARRTGEGLYRLEPSWLHLHLARRRSLRDPAPSLD